MEKLSGTAKRHAEAGLLLKAEQEKIRRKNACMVPRQSQRFTKWEELVAGPQYVPKCTDRVAIIGAGCAGLHMAYLLDELDFKNVTILEKQDRIAGRSFTKYDYDPFVPIEFGTCYTVPFKYAELRRIAKETGYGSFEEIPVPERHLFTDYTDRDPITQREWIISEKIRRWPFCSMPKRLGSALAQAAIGLDLYQYNRNYEALFKRDIQDIITDTNMSFAEYLKQHGFEDLVPVFSLANTVQGYGYIEEVPALYGLWWNSPDEVKGFLLSAVHIVEQPASILRHGFKRFWEFIASNRMFNVKFNFEIQEINRGENVVKITDTSGTVAEYDFVVITSNLPDALEYLDATAQENDILGSLKVNSNLTTTLVSVKHRTDPVPISSWTSSLKPHNKARLMTVRDSYKVFFPEDFGKKDKDHLICYQYEPEATSDTLEHKRVLVEALLSDLTNAGFEEISVLEQHVWPYFQRWDQEGLTANYPVRLMQLQGSNRTWFAGASALFESVHDCMEFNKLLIGMIRRDRENC